MKVRVVDDSKDVIQVNRGNYKIFIFKDFSEAERMAEGVKCKAKVIYDKIIKMSEEWTIKDELFFRIRPRYKEVSFSKEKFHNILPTSIREIFEAESDYKLESFTNGRIIYKIEIKRYMFFYKVYDTDYHYLFIDYYEKPLVVLLNLGKLVGEVFYIPKSMLKEIKENDRKSYIKILKC